MAGQTGMKRLGFGLTLGLQVLLAATVAHAGDGRLEINQACAAGAGCFAGDSPGLPVEISSSGSYLLTSDLAVEDAAMTAISVAESDVSIDLGGFSISGPTVCSGVPVTSCTPTGIGYGIRRLSFSVENVSVSNGTIRGMGAGGIAAGSRSSVSNVRVSQCGGPGISVNRNSRIVESQSDRNGGWGFLVNSTIGDLDNHLSLIVGNVASGNADSGIGVFNSGALIRQNTVDRNGGAGLAVGTDASISYGTNMLMDNAGTVSVSGSGVAIEIDTNVCNGSTTCP